MRTKNILVIVISSTIIVVALLFGFRSLAPNGDQPSPVNFTQEGNVVRDNPGFKPGVWYLVYEQSGSSALTKELDLADIAPLPLQNGEQVHVEGRERAGVVKVTSLQILNGYYDDLIWVEAPLPDQIVASPLLITGQARGNWYFEASFPVTLLDANGKVLVQKPAQAQGDWMTAEYVPFSITLDFINPATDTGTLILHNDNPSGLPENDKELRLPVRFTVASQTVSLYYYNAENDKDASGNILCSSQGLVPAQRQIPVSQTPIQDTINLLLQGQLTATERSAGVTTEYPLSGFTLQGANLRNGDLTLDFSDPENKTGGGSCRVGILWKQIEATAQQFPGVNQVKFIPEFLFQP
ncbi:MAG: hypothetical protein COV31_01190 [Candidatus Yanofskybacteria bacterium CG10_big_fil_rev_8_21_14_0_10_46_23]|uniref:Bacterial spore germination immunoglobulin-like domain-containing protein n=1 Tax=Candidatus Yanofskybacteria bacterium CG10_big_fil_rev_8_21_14_0_10_46_23 TaxID=1975098 RepID=A0A2H0R4M4_9BACT|nr:MAG: hypothetical protein COV31_01190 [Candidatus Yanofskybacteria bacterium CG10_big_fil_rev_8_21_14_0_10_46_23]